MNNVLDINVLQQPFYFPMFKWYPLLKMQKLYFLIQLFIHSCSKKENRKYKKIYSFSFTT